MYSSPLGEAFLANINSTANILNTSTTETTTVLRAVEESLRSILDDTILAYSSAQLMIAGLNTPETARRTVPAVAQLDAVRIGDRAYVISTTALALVISTVAIVELFRTKRWRDLPSFDYRDLQHVILGSWLGGSQFELGYEAASDGMIRFTVNAGEGGYAVLPMSEVSKEASTIEETVNPRGLLKRNFQISYEEVRAEEVSSL
jgi:hypothetical protein